MGRKGMISNGNYYFNQNRFLCSNLNILAIIFITLSLLWLLHEGVSKLIFENMNL